MFSINKLKMQSKNIFLFKIKLHRMWNKTTKSQEQVPQKWNCYFSPLVSRERFHLVLTYIWIFTLNTHTQTPVRHNNAVRCNNLSISFWRVLWKNHKTTRLNPRCSPASHLTPSLSPLRALDESVSDELCHFDWGCISAVTHPVSFMLTACSW